MGIKNILSSFTTFSSSKDYRHKSLFLNIDYLSNSHLQFELLHLGQSICIEKSRIKVDTNIIPLFNSYIMRVCNSGSAEPIENIQKEITSITDDLIPKKISDFLIKNKDVFRYITVEDESVPINIPYGLMFFPDSDVKNCLSSYGFFLSEYYTIARAVFSPKGIASINKVITVSTDDLSGSVAEEREILKFINSKLPSAAIGINSKSDFKRELHSSNPNCIHFCCHGDDKCNIVFNKGSVQHLLSSDCFNLFRFKDNSLVFLNICNSNYTLYDNDVPRSIASKIIDRNAGLVVVTEWPIDDAFAFLIGTNAYKLMENRTIIQIIDDIKKNASSYNEKITAISYSLKGNPNLVYSIN